MNRDGNDWTIPTDTIMVLQPDLQTSVFPINSSKKTPTFQRRHVRFAANLFQVATIPMDYREPLARAKPPKLTFSELRERVATLTHQVCEERRAVSKEQKMIISFQQEYEALKRTRSHISVVKRQAIRDLQCECDKLEMNILLMKSEIDQVKEQTFAGAERRKRRLSQRELNSDAPSNQARMPTIWSKRRLERHNSLELLCS